MTADELATAKTLIEMALAEDLGKTGDRTTLALIPETQDAFARFVARNPGVVAGLSIAELVLRTVDPALQFKILVLDGTRVSRGDLVATVTGSLRSILVGERTALNFLQQLSGVATLTRKYVDIVQGTRAAILDTRKTLPGWRLLQKYAVRQGGGVNHRIGLYDAILIKDNHIAGVNGDVIEAVRRARTFPGNAGLPVEIEVDSLTQLERVLTAKPEIVLLDNMSQGDMIAAVALRDGHCKSTKLEASGGVNLATVREIAETGVDRISIGAITHSAAALDIALDL